MQTAQLIAEIAAIDPGHTLAAFALDLEVDTAARLVEQHPLSLKDRRLIADALRSKEIELMEGDFEDIADEQARRTEFINSVQVSRSAV